MSRQVRVGILVFAGLALFLVALFAIARRSFLFSNTFPLQSQFDNVAGLQAGAPVQYQGANVGRVEQVALPDQPGRPFTVKMAIRHSAQPLVNENTIAQIKSQSLVGGGQMIVLVNRPIADQAGADDPDELEPVEPGGTIPGQEPFNIYEISDQALAAVDTFASVAVEAKQIMQAVQRGRGSLGRFLYDDALYNRTVATIRQAEATAAETQQLMTDLSSSAERVTTSAEEATAGFQEVLAKVNRGEGTLGRLLNDDTIYNRGLAVTDTLLATTRRIENVLATTQNAVNWASLGAYRFSENMEALKHNFLFKPYFEERGYMEKADFEIRESAIEATYEDLGAWQRELNEREARLEEMEARLDAALQESSRNADDSTTESAATDEASPAAPAQEGSASEEEAPGGTSSVSPQTGSRGDGAASEVKKAVEVKAVEVKAVEVPDAAVPQTVKGLLPNENG